MIKFIILSSQRSGSTYLQILLNSHPEIIVGGEIFNPTPQHLIEKGHIPEDKIKLKDSDPEEYLNWFFLSGNKYPAKVMGFRLFYEHGKTEREKIWKILKETHNIRIIHLQRKNLLRQFVSLQLAEKTSRWLRKESEEIYKYEPILIDYKQCLKYFRKQKRKSQRALDFFESSQILEILYEDLDAVPVRVTDEVTGFLGLDPAELSCDLGKQNFQSLSEVISNYVRLKNRFQDTEWEVYFED